MNKLLIFLQNAWRPGASFKTRDEWLLALWESYSGKRLKEMIPDDIEFYVENSSTKVGDNSNSIFPPDLLHMKNVIDFVKPNIILACGKIAQKGLDALKINYIQAPHPAYRALSKEMTNNIKERIIKCQTK